MPSARSARAASASSSRTGTWPPSSGMGSAGSKAQALESRGQSARERDRLRHLRLPLDLVPELELLALPDEHDPLVEACVAAQRGRHEDAAGGVQLDVVGM